MASKFIVFSGDKVALIVRGKRSDGHSPGKLAQHADCALSNGSPVGYFGGASSGSSGSDSGESSGGLGYKFGAVLIGIRGEVYEMGDFLTHRPFYVNSKRAQSAGVISTVLTVQVANGEATKFDEYWAALKADPGKFRLLGKNCSTRASGAFRHAEILSGGIPGMDTPNNLYKQLKAERADRCSTDSGYVGFADVGNSRAIQIMPVE
jgi:hypothetical protein